MNHPQKNTENAENVTQHKLDSISADEWNRIEQSVCDEKNNLGTPLTAADFVRYRSLARGNG
jgi:hypothetical protein